MAIRKIIKRATDSLFTNPEFDGTEAARQVKGTTAERTSAEAGDMRFNTTTSLMEYYDGVQWKSIDAPPIVSSISPSNIADTDSSVDIVISGSNFSTSPTVTAIGQDASVITPTTVVRNSSTQITATFDGTDFLDAQEDYGIKVENISGLSNTLGSALAVNASPVWTVASGSLGSFYDSERSSISITTGATDDEGATLTYAVASGSLPSGLSLNTSTGAITGTATAVGSDTTSNFTLSVTDGTNTVTRAYSIEIKAPVVTSYTSTGSGTFSVPSGISVVDVLVVAGGGGGGGGHPGADGFNGGAGGGGAGGLIYRPAFPVTPGGSVSYSVGGGASQTNANGIGASGQDSTFGALTAKGGGGGGRVIDNPDSDGRPGGSGGGAADTGTGGFGSGGGSATQPQQPGDSSTYGFGNAGGSVGPGNAGGAGGGGANANGASNPTGDSVGRNGGDGKQYDISGSQVYYAAGGGGAGGAGQSPGGVGGQGGGGAGGSYQNSPWGPASGIQGQSNRGGGGGGGAEGGGTGGAGGSGIVIVSY